MIEVWKKCASFQTTSQKLADQVRTIIRKCWFSDLEILEIHQKINNEQNSNLVPNTSRINKQKQPNRNELPISENENATQPNNLEQTLTQEQKINLEILKGNMNGEKKHRMKNSQDENEWNKLHIHK